LHSLQNVSISWQTSNQRKWSALAHLYKVFYTQHLIGVTNCEKE